MKNQDVLSLVRAHVYGDDARFLAVARAMAANAGAAGQAKASASILALVEDARGRATPKRSLPHEVSGIVTVRTPTQGLSGLVLPDDLSSQVRRLVDERRMADELSERGLRPRRRIVLCGPPGTGKSMTAAALAGELGLDLYEVHLSGLVSSHLGETGAKMARVFGMMGAYPGVYLFDEIDALAGTREGGQDVGEARRIVNALLQCLDGHVSDSLVIATTNMPSILDRAVVRRFDAVLHYGMPAEDAALDILWRRLGGFDLAGLDRDRVRGSLEGHSQGDLAAAADDAGREAVVANGGSLTGDILLRALWERAAMRVDASRP